MPYLVRILPIVLFLALAPLVLGQEKPETGGAKSPTASSAEAAKAAEEAELQLAIQSSRGSQQQVIENLDAFLKKYPKASRRVEIERTIFKLAGEMRDRSRQIEYAERIISSDGSDLEMLTVLITALRERKAAGDLTRALNYSDQLVKGIDSLFASRVKPAKISSGNWEQQKSRALASVYLMRGQVQTDLGNLEKSEADLLRSYKYSPLATTASLLAGIAEKRKNADGALDYFLQAFARSIDSTDGIDRAEIRQKLGRLYAAKHGNETGLGDRILKTYDLVTREDAERLARYEPPNPNQKVSDHLQFRLTRLNGTEVKLDDYKGKVIVANFWATWCGPCRIEMPELERAMIKYRDDRDVVFLAINTDDDREYVEPYVKGQNLKLPVVYANQLDAFFGITQIPTTIIFDRTGQVAYRQAGFSTSEDFVVAISDRIEAAKTR